METAFAVGVEISLGGNLGKVIAGMIEQFGKLDQAVKTTQTSVNQLASAMGALARQATAGARAFDNMESSAAKAASAAERAANAGAGSRWRDNVAAGAPTGGTRAAPLMLTGPTERGAPASGRSLVPSTGNGYSFGGGAPIPIVNPFGGNDEEAAPTRASRGGKGDDLMVAAIGGMALRMLAYPFASAAKIDDLIATLKAQGLTSEQIKQALDQALKTQQQVKPATYAGNLEITSALMAVLQDPVAALKLQPAYSKMAATLSPQGQADAADLLASMRSGELLGLLGETNPKTGKMEVNPAKLQPFIEKIIQLDYMTHGQVGPAQFHQFLMSGGIAAAMQDSEKVMSDNAALILAMGAQRAGTALKGFSQQFSSGKMNKGIVHILGEQGIITNPKAVIPAGMGYYILDKGAMPQSAVNMARTDPVAFVTEYMEPKIKTWLAQKYGDQYTKASERQQNDMLMAALQQDASRMPGGTYLSEVIRNLALIERDRSALDKMPSSDQIFGIQQQNPYVAWGGFTSALSSFSTIVGTPAMADAVKNLTTLTGALNSLTNFGKAHPEATATAFESIGAFMATFTGGTIIRFLTKLAGFDVLLGPEVAALSAVAAATTSVTKGFQAIDAEMRKVFPWAYPGKNAAPLPQDGGTLYRPGWVPRWVPHSIYPGADLPSSPSAAPGAQSQSYAPPAGTQTGSMPVHVTGGSVNATVTNGRDLVNGVASGIAHQTNRPEQGYSGANLNLEPWSTGLYNTVP